MRTRKLLRSRLKKSAVSNQGIKDFLESRRRNQGTATMSRQTIQGLEEGPPRRAPSPEVDPLSPAAVPGRGGPSLGVEEDAGEPDWDDVREAREEIRRHNRENL